ncbi:MAG TPA: DUF5615 family PIN-like protein [Acidimicrobiales bacterium]|nr:DUF5615 family PIN-like protein [Acidimicrobiales bacterium]
MRFLVDEMSGTDLAAGLRENGHTATHVVEVGLAGAHDRDVVAHAAEHDSVVVTENAVDFVPLLDERMAAGLPTPAVVIALKRKLPAEAGAMNHVLAKRLTVWAKAHPDPYRHVHWLGADETP